MAETQLIREVILSAAKVGARLFRQNTGMGWVGKLIGKVRNGRAVLEDARPFHAGLCTGSSDSLGWAPVVITPEMVGRTVAVFTAVEIKTGKVPVTKEQKAFLNAVRSQGGIAILYREGDPVSVGDQIERWSPPAG